MLGDNVRRKREQLGWSQEELAKKVGKKQQNIEQLENGKVASPRYLGELLRVLGLTYDEAMSSKPSPPILVLSRIASDYKAGKLSDEDLQVLEDHAEYLKSKKK